MENSELNVHINGEILIQLPNGLLRDESIKNSPPILLIFPR